MSKETQRAMKYLESLPDAEIAAFLAKGAPCFYFERVRITREEVIEHMIRVRRKIQAGWKLNLDLPPLEFSGREI